MQYFQFYNHYLKAKWRRRKAKRDSRVSRTRTSVLLFVFVLLLELKVTLREGSTSNQGRVELSVNGTWGTICDDHWGIKEGDVICRMLGYSEGAWGISCCGWYDDASTALEIWLDDVHCDGDEQSIAECRHGGWGNHNCKDSDAVGVVCKHTPKTKPGKVLLFTYFFTVSQQNYFIPMVNQLA